MSKIGSDKAPFRVKTQFGDRPSLHHDLAPFSSLFSAKVETRTELHMDTLLDLIKDYARLGRREALISARRFPNMEAFIRGNL